MMQLGNQDRLASFNPMPGDQEMLVAHLLQDGEGLNEARRRE